MRLFNLVFRQVIIAMVCLIAMPVIADSDSDVLTAHSNLFVTPTHGGLSWTSDKLLGRNILILHSYHEDDQRTRNLNDGIRQAFDEADESIRYWIEYLDSKRFPYDSNTDILKDVYKYKYSNKRLDAVIVTGNQALEFALQYRDLLFYATPVIFTDIRNLDSRVLKGQEKITGVFEKETDEIFDTVDIAMQFHKNAEHIILLSPGVRDRSMANTLREKYKNVIDVQFYNNYFMSDIEKVVLELDENNIILTTTEPRTKAGANVPYFLFNERLASISASPVYAVTDTGLGSGIIGGKLISGKQQGIAAARMVLQLFRGKTADEIPFMKDSPGLFMFDYNQLQRFGIKEQELPKSSIVINKPYSIYNEYKNEINIALGLLLVQAMVICLLVFVNRKRKLAESALKDANENLEQRVRDRSRKLTESNIQLTNEIQERIKIERALRASEEKYSKALLYSADAIIITSLDDNKMVEVNEAFEKISGFSREEVIGKSGKELELWSNRNERQRFYRELGNTGSINNFESDFINRRGETRTMSMSAEIFEYQNKPHLITISRDISEQKKTTLELKRYEQIISSTKDFMSFVDVQYRYQAVNNAYLDAFNKTREEIIGCTITDLQGEERFRNIIKPRFDRCLHGETVNLQHWYNMPGNKTCFLDIVFTPYFEDGVVTGVVISGRDITAARKLSEQLQYQATHDSLTDLINRHEFEQRVNRLLESDDPGGHEHVLCYLDLDTFKVINDTCGHAAGDELLRQLGLLLRKHVRQRDSLARLGGDEFGALFENCTLDRAMQIMSKLQDAVNELRFVWEDKSFTIGVSIGLVAINHGTTTVEELLKQADSACYMAKTDGRNCIRVYEHDNAKLARIQGVIQWIHPVNEALENDSFRLYQQPIMRLNPDNTSVALSHFEVLVRMEKNDDLILPGKFLPAVEQYGLSGKLDKWVISRVFEYLRENTECDDHSKYFINLSGLSLSSSELMQYIEHELYKDPDMAHRICFEITETAAIANYAHASYFIDALRDRGCEFALDDFGSGFSSFAYLKNLELDYIKIDGMFVRDITTDPLAYSMVNSINEIGHISGVRTIAEFVENDNILHALSKIGVDYVQGYGIGIPQPVDFDPTGAGTAMQNHLREKAVSIRKS